MIIRNKLEESNEVIDQAAQSADEIIKVTRRVANEALESLAEGVEDVRQQGAPLLNRATDSTANYIKEDPIKAILIAAAVGAALMAMVNLMGRSRDS
ncbi:MAG: hypothetical protein K0B16_16770 [Burkholderiaceae bacterium]|nr:hypothetical protein [Burkholderiaceae bacterium]